jgi:primosomal protein N' (replication factor Y) (superfamily II helicase)
MSSPALYAKILINLPIEGPFDYEVPSSLKDGIALGKRVWVNFGPRRMIGYVIGVSESTDCENTKPVLEIIDKDPILSDEMLKLTKSISERYMCSWGEAINAAIPSSIKKGNVSVKPREEGDDISLIAPTEPFKPTEEQADALKKINQSIDKHEHQVFLLHGITGSGKTEVYLQAIGNVLSKGRSCIVLVPEISLTPQAIERFKARFRERVAVFHSRLTAGQKYREWKKLADGLCHIVVGARSAIFSPIKDLGLIIVDEEHDTSYKQQDAPRYHAVDAAIMRAKISDAVVVLGGATPSLESYYKACSKEYRLLELNERIERRPLPEVKILDMRQEIMERHKKRIIFSRILIEHLEKVIQNNEQAILFLNRRGFSTYANCKKCGYVERCKKCNVALNYHSDKKILLCHYCNYQKKPVDICPSCKEGYIDYFGFGTQRVESELHRYFPTISVSRMDTDSTKKRKSHDQILSDFSKRKTQVLIGTQMVAKGHDFPMVTLVGVVAADIALNLPDFRAGERTFQLLTQVAGRAGRGNAPGEVIIQTYVPHHYTIQSAIKHDYRDFYKKEITFRRQLYLPPFSNIVYLTLRSYKEERAQKAAEELARHILKKKLSYLMELSGPCQAMIYRLRRQYRWNIILKVKDLAGFNPGLKGCLKEFKKPYGVILTIDVDSS